MKRQFTKEETAIAGEKSHQRSLELQQKYSENPNRCKHCNNELEYNKRANKYCNQSCSASFNNLGKQRFFSTKDFENCPMCQKEVKSRKSNFCSLSCSKEYKIKTILKDSIVSGNAATRKKRLIDIKGYKCEICGLTEWRDKPAPLVCDHINGNSEDNRLDNLRLLCQNCNAQTDTFAGKNPKGSGRFYRMKKYREGKSW